jgi:hypothetical protein
LTKSFSPEKQAQDVVQALAVAATSCSGKVKRRNRSAADSSTARSPNME